MQTCYYIAVGNVVQRHIYMITEQSIPRANTVLFYSDRDYSTLTWSYAEPRVLTNIHINPIPFDYPTDPNATFHCLDIQVYSTKGYMICIGYLYP